MKKQILNLLLVLLIFPISYIGLSLTPWANELFVKGNESFFSHFWISVIIMHWLSFCIILRILKKENYTLKDIGYKLNRRKTIILVFSYFIVALLVFGFTEMSLKYVDINQEKLQSLGNFFPKTTLHRIIFIFTVFSAGFCEEIIYRGFAIIKLVNVGLNKWLAIIPAGISFVFMHGIIGFSQFWFYFIPAIILGLIFILSKRLLPGIILHLLYDLMAMMAIFNAIN